MAMGPAKNGHGHGCSRAWGTVGSGTCHPGWRQASPPQPAATREEATAWGLGVLCTPLARLAQSVIGRGARGGGRVWSVVPTEMQGREGVTDPLLLRRVSPSTALLMPSLMPSWGPSWAGPGHTSRPLLPGPLPHIRCPPASSAPAPRQESALTLSTSCSVLGPRDGVHGQGAKSHLPAHASPSGPSEESSPPSSGPPQPPECPPAEPSTSPLLPQCKLSLSRQFSLSADLRVSSRGLSLSLSPYI